MGTETAQADFYHDFGAIKVKISGDMKLPCVQVAGPKDFVDGLDWDNIMRVAGLFATQCAPFMAVALAVQQQYAAWRGLRQLV